MFAVFGRWLARQVHPGAGSLVAFADGELAPLANVWVKQHLKVCPSCRREVERLQEDLVRFQLFVQPTRDVELEQGLRDLRQAMGQLVHNVNPVRAVDLDSVARRRFVAELETYLGKRAAATLLGGLSQDNRLHELVSASLPALAALLGRKAAEAITKRVFKPQGFDSGAA
jgi:anti-sigma factor RsiW